MAKNWSSFQLGIFDWVEQRQGKNLVVEAVAGSGKTTTGEEMISRVPVTEPILATAFNKHIQEEMQRRLPNHVDVKTYHALGLQVCFSSFGKIKVDTEKMEGFLKLHYDRYEYNLIYPTKRLISLVKGNLSGTTDDELSDLAMYHSVDLYNRDREYMGDYIFDGVRAGIAWSKRIKTVVDFDDMVWLPLVADKNEVSTRSYDFMFVDELQDTNAAQIQLALLCSNNGTRIVGVGDRYQSIYGFRGADVDAIPNLIQTLNADTLPLSITYRNPTSVVDNVKAEFPHIPIMAADNAIEGTVADMPYEQAISILTPGDMVLCRVNAPLVRPAFDLIRSGTKAVILGRDIGKGLKTFIKQFRTSESVVEMLYYMNEYTQREVAKLTAANRGHKAIVLQDKAETIIALSDKANTISEIEDRIDFIFDDEKKGVSFSTVHKAKGLEAKNIFILNPELMPHPMARQAWEQEQEDNIKYVAKTRSLDTLIFVQGG